MVTKDTGKKGFTLIEVLVGLVILSIGVLASVQLNLLYVRANTFANQMSEATAIAQAKMEQLRQYARSDRSDIFSPFDFDYLISTDANFTSVYDPTQAAATDPADASVVIPGMLSGSGSTLVTIDPGWGISYDQLYDSGATSSRGNTIYEGKQTETAGTMGMTFPIELTWTVEPLPQDLDGDGETDTDFALVNVKAEWLDKIGQPHDVAFNSLIGRRQ